MQDLHENRLFTVGALLHIEDSSKGGVNILVRCEMLHSSSVRCLPSKLILVMVETHHSIDAIQEVIVLRKINLLDKFFLDRNLYSDVSW